MANLDPNPDGGDIVIDSEGEEKRDQRNLRSWCRSFHLKVPAHMGTKCKPENEQPFTEKLHISFFLKVFYNWLFVFCFAFCAYMGRHPKEKR